MADVFADPWFREGLPEGIEAMNAYAPRQPKTAQSEAEILRLIAEARTLPPPPPPPRSSASSDDYLMLDGGCSSSSDDGSDAA